MGCIVSVQEQDLAASTAFFKSSKRKTARKWAPVPTNLHVQRLTVQELVGDDSGIAAPDQGDDSSEVEERDSRRRLAWLTPRALQATQHAVEGTPLSPAAADTVEESAEQALLRGIPPYGGTEGAAKRRAWLDMGDGEDDAGHNEGNTSTAVAVESGTTTPAARTAAATAHSIVTVGVPAVHLLGFKQGGLFSQRRRWRVAPGIWASLALEQAYTLGQRGLDFARVNGLYDLMIREDIVMCQVCVSHHGRPA